MEIWITLKCLSFLHRLTCKNTWPNLRSTTSQNWAKFLSLEISKSTRCRSHSGTNWKSWKESKLLGLRDPWLCPSQGRLNQEVVIRQGLRLREVLRRASCPSLLWSNASGKTVCSRRRTHSRQRQMISSSLRSASRRAWYERTHCHWTIKWSWLILILSSRHQRRHQILSFQRPLKSRSRVGSATKWPPSCRWPSSWTSVSVLQSAPSSSEQSTCSYACDCPKECAQINFWKMRDFRVTANGSARPPARRQMKRCNKSSRSSRPLSRT